uniref:Uncharacterized protein n=1 Tax=viral metagenome TaxID=1070528 RepID=A0A6C0ANN6_9ZZZZ
MSQPITTPGYPSRPGGNINDSTVFRSRHDSVWESYLCKGISEGLHKTPLHGSPGAVCNWSASRKHDPTRAENKRILGIVRISGEKGVSNEMIAAYIQEYFNEIPEETLNRIRELEKQGLIYENSLRMH